MANSEQLEASEKELHGEKVEKQEEVVSVELPAPKGWKKKTLHLDNQITSASNLAYIPKVFDQFRKDVNQSWELWKSFSVHQLPLSSKLNNGFVNNPLGEGLAFKQVMMNWRGTEND
ncbi:hypothetical protein Syun_002398 [Stephania yunnanensis]|uniref:Uncharacterized protein n=1 Tax=Stephania yunnanensis TaxID=152371 RepID=A0AAP0Q7Z9_9MAGN